jgi:methionyl-tRNA formyltransferase
MSSWSAGSGKTAVVFAYHNVGVRCLKVLLAQGVKIALVLTHQDNPLENIWFESVADLCREHGIAFETPDQVAGVVNGVDLGAAWVERIAEIAPDFIFSFYYRNMLPMALLGCAKQGALNMHGSLLPQYRGRVPVNWAIVRGETRTGATLHYMVEKPDAGDIVAQQAVPILPDDTAHEVFNKVCTAAEIALDAVLPSLLAGTAVRSKNDLSLGGYFGGRKPSDGRIDLGATSAQIYNLIRAVAPPYPGAYLEIPGQATVWVDGAQPVRHAEMISILEMQAARSDAPLLRWQGQSYLRGADGLWLKLLLRK